MGLADSLPDFAVAWTGTEWWVWLLVALGAVVALGYVSTALRAVLILAAEEGKRGDALERAQELYPVSEGWSGPRLCLWPHSRLEHGEVTRGPTGGFAATLRCNEQGLLVRHAVPPSFLLGYPQPPRFLVPWEALGPPRRMSFGLLTTIYRPTRGSCAVVLPIEGLDLTLRLRPKEYRKIRQHLADAPGLEDVPALPAQENISKKLDQAAGWAVTVGLGFLLWGVSTLETSESLPWLFGHSAAAAAGLLLIVAGWHVALRRDWARRTLELYLWFALGVVVTTCVGAIVLILVYHDALDECYETMLALCAVLCFYVIWPLYAGISQLSSEAAISACRHGQPCETGREHLDGAASE